MVCIKTTKGRTASEWVEFWCLSQAQRSPLWKQYLRRDLNERMQVTKSVSEGREMQPKETGQI
jgi:hypothetical protein